MKRVVGVLFLALALLVGVASDHASREIPTPSASRETLTEFLAGVADTLLRQSPETITTRGVSQKLGVRNDTLDSLVLDATGESYAPLERALERIESSDLMQETDRDRRAIEVFAWWLRDAIAGRPFQRDTSLVSTYMTSAPQRLVWFMTEIHPLRTEVDAEDYLSRLGQIPARFDQLVVRLEQSEQVRALPPRFLLERAADEIEAIGRGPAETSKFYTRFAERLDAMTDIGSDAQRALLDNAARCVSEVVGPAYVGLAEKVRAFAARATDDAGVWKVPDGEAYYAYLLRAYTTTDMTADEIYQFGLREVARLQDEIRAAAADLGFDPSLSLADLFAEIRAACGVVSGDDAVRDCRTLVAEAGVLARPAFLRWPTRNVAVEAGEDIAYFVEGAEDGSRPGAFFVPVEQVRPTFSLRSLTYHETIPGHFLQTAIAQESALPPFLGGVAFSAFSEGWATYAERLAWELGAYEDDPYGNLGRLQEELFRAARLVVDPGIHARRWTYEEAVRYMMQATGLAEATVRDEVERYIVTPGQAVAYGVGFFKFLELRERARQALGPAFDLAEFHDAILAYGSVPLPVLEEIVDDFIVSHLPAPAGNP